MDEEEEKEKKRKRQKDIKSQKKPSVPRPVIPKKKDGVLKPGNSASGFQASVRASLFFFLQVGKTRTKAKFKFLDFSRLSFFLPGKRSYRPTHKNFSCTVSFLSIGFVKPEKN